MELAHLKEAAWEQQIEEFDVLPITFIIQVFFKDADNIIVDKVHFQALKIVIL